MKGKALIEQGSSHALQQVYGAKDADELESAYADWANDYDRETAELGYCLPFIVPAWLARYTPPSAGAVLDAGCGTGLSGPYLKALGYPHVEGVDLSADMLEFAQARGVYADLKRAKLGEKLPWPDGHFAAVVAAGVFTAGHAPPSSFDELTRVTETGGHIIFSLRDCLINGAGFGAKLEQLEKQGLWRLTERSPPFRTFAVAEPEVFGHVYVYQVMRRS